VSGYFSIREEFGAGLVIDQKLERLYELANRRLSPKAPQELPSPKQSTARPGKRL